MDIQQNHLDLVWLFTDINWDDVFMNPDKMVKCPVCGNENVHIIGLAINMGGRCLVITGKENVLELLGPPTGRGVSIWIRFQCEEFHFWRTHYQFHKGSTYFNDEIETYRDIWRD